MEVWTWEMGVGADGASQQSEFHFSRLQEHPKTVTHFLVLDKKPFFFNDRQNLPRRSALI